MFAGLLFLFGTYGATRLSITSSSFSPPYSAYLGCSLSLVALLFLELDIPSYTKSIRLRFLETRFPPFAAAEVDILNDQTKEFLKVNLKNQFNLFTVLKTTRIIQRSIIIRMS